MAKATSDDEESGGGNQDWLGQLGPPIAVAAIGALVSSLISALTKLQPLAVFAAAAGIALLVVIKLRSPQTTVGSSGSGTETLGVAVALSLLFLASYLLVRSL